MSRSASMSVSTVSWVRGIARVAAATLGGYVFAWGLIAAVTALAFKAGMGFHDAEFLASMLGVLSYLAVLLWAVASRRLALTWLALVGGGALLAAIGSLVQSSIIV